MVALLLAVALASAVELADEPGDPGSLGLGVGGGTAVSGLSGKLPLSGGLAVQAVVGGAGYSHDYGRSALGVDVDVLWEMPELVRAEEGVALAWSLGAGGWTWVGAPFWLGANGVLGLELRVLPVPLDLVLEWRPSLRLVPEVGVELVDFGGHLRIWFR